MQTSSNGVRLYVRRWGGRGHGVLLIHGLASSSHIWDLVAPRLVRLGLEPVAYDQRGHGRSGKPSSGYGFERTTADAASGGSTPGHLTVDAAVTVERGRVEISADGAAVVGSAGDLTTGDGSVFVADTWSVSCAALAALRQSKGLIVAISSLAGKTGVPFRSAYCASKHAMQGFFDSLRLELDGTGIDVTLVSPGFVATGIRANALGGDGRVLGESPLDERDVMALDECGRLILDAMERRKREVIMTNSPCSRRISCFLASQDFAKRGWSRSKRGLPVT